MAQVSYFGASKMDLMVVIHKKAAVTILAYILQFDLYVYLRRLIGELNSCCRLP